MIRKLIYKTYRGIPRTVIQQIYDDLYDKRISVIVGVDSSRLDSFSITFNRKYGTTVSLLIAKYLDIHYIKKGGTI